MRAPLAAPARIFATRALRAFFAHAPTAGPLPPPCNGW
jgi:hypothetical protein